MTSEQAAAFAVCVQGLEKSYMGQIVLRRVDFEIPAGTIFALLVIKCPTGSSPESAL